MCFALNAGFARLQNKPPCVVVFFDERVIHEEVPFVYIFVEASMLFSLVSVPIIHSVNCDYFNATWI